MHSKTIKSVMTAVVLAAIVCAATAKPAKTSRLGKCASSAGKGPIGTSYSYTQRSKRFRIVGRLKTRDQHETKTFEQTVRDHTFADTVLCCL